MITDERELVTYQNVASKQRNRYSIDLPCWKGKENHSIWLNRRKRARAFCTALKCNGGTHTHKCMSIGNCNIKFVSIWAIDCPDCGNALFWSQFYIPLTIEDQ